MSKTSSAGTIVPTTVIVSGAPPAKPTNSPSLKGKKTNLSTGNVGALVAFTVVCTLYDEGSKVDFINHSSTNVTGFNAVGATGLVRVVGAPSGPPTQDLEEIHT